MLAWLEVSLWPHEILGPMQLSDPSFPKPSPHIFVQSCNWIICQSSHTMENPQHNSSSKSFKLTSRVPRCIIPCQHIPWFYQRQWIRTKFLPSDSTPDPFLFSPAPPPKLITFIPATLTEIHKLIFASEKKQCPLDSITTFLLKLCFNELGPIITNLVNLSLSEGIFPSSFKQALVQPLLKKPSLSTDDLNNFRPISNLNFISKILEKVVASCIQSHHSKSLSSSFQSAYRIFHSTETTLLKLHNDLILAMDSGEVTSLILLDLSAAFWYCWSFHPSHSSSKLGWSWWSFA